MAAETVHRVDFHGTRYVLTTLVVGTGAGDTLLVDVEQDSAPGASLAASARWKGEFSAQYVESLTHKTGNSKRFSVFVEMLRSALRGDSQGSVFVDLLTTGDLAELNSRRSRSGGGGGNTSLSSSASGAAGSRKRYLILTYTAAFDKVHYPLPLAYDAEPSTLSLQRTIRRLRRELAAKGGAGVGAGGGVAAAPGPAGGGLLGGGSGGDNAAAVKARNTLHRYRESAEAEIAQLKKDCKSLAIKLKDARTKLKQQQQQQRGGSDSGGGSGLSSKHAREQRSMERKIRALQQQVQREKDAAKRLKSTAGRQASKLKEEVRSLKSSLTRMRSQLKDANRRNALSTTPRGRRTVRSRSRTGGRVGARGRSTSSTRSGSSSVNRSTSSRLSRSSRDSRSSVRSASARSARPARTGRARVPRVKSASRKGRSTRMSARSAAARRTPSPTPRSNYSYGTSTGRRSNASSSGGSRYRSSARSSTRRGVRKTAGTSSASASRGGSRRTKTRRSKRHPSPFDGYSSTDSLASSVDSQRRRRKATTTTTKKKKKKKKKTATMATARGGGPSPARVNGAQPRAPAANAPKPMPAPPSPTKENMLPSFGDGAAVMASASADKLATSSFNASSEMADIDRRLNALQVCAGRDSFAFLLASWCTRSQLYTWPHAQTHTHTHRTFSNPPSRRPLQGHPSCRDEKDGRRQSTATDVRKVKHIPGTRRATNNEQYKMYTRIRTVEAQERG